MEVLNTALKLMIAYHGTDTACPQMAKEWRIYLIFISSLGTILVWYPLLFYLYLVGSCV